MKVRIPPQTKVLLSCGHLGRAGSHICRSCYRQHAKDVFVCPDCGGVKYRYSQLCRSCSNKRQTILRVCVDCGDSAPTRLRPGHVLRCRRCQNLWRQNQPKPPCIEEGCSIPQRKWHRCPKHANAWYRRQHPRPKEHRRSKKEVGQMPCAICGWNEFTCDVDRIDPTKGYVNGNMVPLCPNHHRLVTFGLIPRPDIRL